MRAGVPRPGAQRGAPGVLLQGVTAGGGRNAFAHEPGRSPTTSYGWSPRTRTSSRCSTRACWA